MALFAAYVQAREKVVKMLTDYLESRPVKDSIYNKFIQTRGHGRDVAWTRTRSSDRSPIRRP
jgi:hypothetical protein